MSGAPEPADRNIPFWDIPLQDLQSPAMASIHSREYRAFLRKLRQARLDAGLTQAEVAARLNRPQSFVSKCESGERRVDVVELSLFASLYGKTLAYFAARASD
jgi:DNA-binding transcriptional regulator YiaG